MRFKQIQVLTLNGTFVIVAIIGTIRDSASLTFFLPVTCLRLLFFSNLKRFCLLTIVGDILLILFICLVLVFADV